MTTLLTSTKAVGFTDKAVIARIRDLDIDAAGNCDRAAWKRYLALCLMAIAKGTSKKTLSAAVFGIGAKPSKTFSNMWSMAEKCRANVTGNGAWSDILPLGVEDAFEMVLGWINRHMAMHGVAGKNAYEVVCHLSPAEAEAAKATAKAEKAAEEAEAAEEAKGAAEEAEAKAKDKADAIPERTAAEAAIAALHDAKPEDLAHVLSFVLSKLDNAELAKVRGLIDQVLGNVAPAADAAPVKAKRKA